MVILEKASYSVGEILRIDAPRPGTPSFGKDHYDLLPLQEVVAFGKGRLHFFPVPSPTDGDAFRKIAQNRHEKASLEICPFREIPGKALELHHMAAQRH